MLTGPLVEGPFPTIGRLVDARKMPVYVKIQNSNQGMWMRLSRSLTPVVKVPGLTRVAVIYRPQLDLDACLLPGQTRH